MSVPDWADKYRTVPRGAGRVTGQWKTSRVEVARGPMLAVTEPGVRIITGMCATQVFKTELLLNAIGHQAHLDPGPFLLVQPKDDAVESFSKERLQPMISATPELKKRVASGKGRSSENTLSYKAFPGGFLALAAAGSPTNMSSRPIKRVFYDEVDKYPVTREGDPVELGDERLATYGAEALSVRVCSPTIEEESRIAASYAESDQRRCSVECQACGHRQFLDFFAHVDWPKRRNERDEVIEHLTAQAAINCEACGTIWSEADRLAALQTCRWHQTRPFECCGQRQKPLEAYLQAWSTSDREGKPEVDELTAPPVSRETSPVDRVWSWLEDRHEGRYAVYRARCARCERLPVPNTHAGFQASKLYSPWERDRPAQIAAKWIRAKGNADRMLVWWNTQMGLPHKPSAGRKIDADTLLKRREVWNWPVPDGAAILTVGVDVQDYRLELEVVGWGRDEESWSIDYHVIEGEFKDPETQAALDEFLKRRWRRSDGRLLMPSATCIDSGGHHTQAVYGFSKERLGRRIFAIKGASEPGGMRNPVWPAKKPLRRTKSTFRPVIIGGNTARDTIRSRLTMDVDAIPPAHPVAGYMHFPHDRDVGYFDQILADKIELRDVGGVIRRVWITPEHRANEAADCRVYAYAALCGLIHFGLQLNRLVERSDAAGPGAVDDAGAPQARSGGPAGPAAPRTSTLGQRMVARFGGPGAVGTPSTLIADSRFAGGAGPGPPDPRFA